ncbi:hypothetical protein [Celerinatantimonas sp. YJH-8]|uniref:hypothetical protein n=1 Tax=Celerinatantimonas sp. YJH-8 TaxID=3228714 RepID=UPI0038CB3ECD
MYLAAYRHSTGIAKLIGNLLAIVLLSTVLIERCLAYGNGLLPVPAHLQSYRKMMLQDPQSCSEALARVLAPRANDQLISSDAGERILLHQIAALCANHNHYDELALAHIDQAISLSRQNSIPLLTIRSYLIKAQINLETKGHLAQAETALATAGQLIQQIENPLPLSLQYQWQQIQAHLQFCKGQPDLAKPFLERADQIAHATHNALMIGWSQLYLGRYHQQINQPLQALSHYTEAIRYASTSGPAINYLRSHLNYYLSEVYQQQQQWEKAIEYQRMAIESAQQLNNAELTAQYIAAIATIYRNMQQYGLALVQYLNAQELAHSHQNLLLVAQTDFWIGQTYFLGNDNAQALLHLNQALRYFQRHPNPEWLSATLIKLAEIYIQEGEPAMAIIQLSKAELLAQSAPQEVDIALIQLTLAHAYENTGALAQALLHYKRFEQLNRLQLQHQIEQTQHQFSQNYQFIEQQQQLAKLTQKNQQLQLQNHNRRLLMLLLLIFSVVFCLLFILVKFQLKKTIRDKEELKDRLYYHPRTGWPALELVESPLERLHQLKRYPMTVDLHPVKEHTIIVAHFNELPLSHKRFGFEQRKQLETSFAHHLYHHLEDEFVTGHLGELDYLFITPTRDQLPQQICQKLMPILEQFIQTRKLAVTVALGCCQTPFLPKAEDAIGEQGLLEISYLAMDAAVDLAKQTQTPQWVILQALACSPAAFFGDSDKLMNNIRHAIHQGLVKVISSSDKNLIEW